MCEDSIQFKPIPVEILDLVTYDPTTGASTCSTGRIKELKGRRVYQHPTLGQFSLARLVWFKQTGEDPGLNVVDHKDTNSLNDTWGNLRLATRVQNSQNKSMHKNNTSGIKGVCWDKSTGKWRARITSKGKLLYSEYFDDLQEASEKISAKRKELQGEFARDS